MRLFEREGSGLNSGQFFSSLCQSHPLPNDAIASQLFDALTKAVG